MAARPRCVLPGPSCWTSRHYLETPWLVPQLPLTLLPWLDLFFLGPWSPSTPNLTSALSLHPTILQQGQSCLFVLAKSADTGSPIPMAQQEVSLTQPLGRLVHIPLLGPPLSNAQCCFPHGSMCLIHSGTWDVNTSTCIWVSWAKQTRVGHRPCNHWLTQWSPLEPNAVLPSTTAICVKSSEDGPLEGPCQRGHAMSPTLSPTKRSKTQVFIV